MYNFLPRRTSRFLPLLLTLAAPLAHADKLVPAGSIVQCTVSEPRLNSKTVAVGDPVLCQVTRSNVFPASTQLQGVFEDYKDPGHLFGKGWMELVFDNVIFPDSTKMQIDARVIAVPHYKVDLEGKIHGNGHAVRDTFMWMIPVLWPIDLIELPRRGPRPTLKNESRITLKVMQDVFVPEFGPSRNQYGFANRQVSRLDQRPVETYDPGTTGDVFMAGPHDGDLVRPIFHGGASEPDGFNVSNGTNGVDLDRRSTAFWTYMRAYKSFSKSQGR